MSYSDFEFLILLFGGGESRKKKTKRSGDLFKKVWHRCNVFSESGYSYVSLQHVFKISRQAVNCIAPEVREDHGEKMGR